MPTLMPTDINDNAIPALRLRASGAHAIAAGATSARNTAAFNAETRVVSLYATVPVYVKFGNSAVTATASDHYYPAGLYYDFAVGGDQSGHYTHVAVLRASSDGTVYVSEKE
jgi:hypothetical protein